MKTVPVEDVDYNRILDSYSTCKYLERQGFSLEEVNLGNVHDFIEEITDNTWLPITQVINPDNLIEGYIIGA